jgi:hypothetical protein
MDDTMEDLAVYILEWLRNRNGAELMDSFDNMTVRGFQESKRRVRINSKARWQAAQLDLNS